MRNPNRFYRTRRLLIGGVLAAAWIASGLGMPRASGWEPPLERIEIDDSGRHMVTAISRQPFVPLGFNYGNRGRLIEDFWENEWPTIVDDFQEMKELGANVVRVHLQFNKFMRSPDQVDERSVQRFQRLLELSEKVGLYLDVTGLACYRPSDTPAWYDELNESQRWSAQAVFWRAIATEGAKSPALFCYDLMNEPLSPSGEGGSWYSGKLFGEYDFLQRISLTLGKRTRGEVAVAWIEHLRGEIRKADSRALVTVGMLPWVTGWGHLSGMVPSEMASHLDFLSVHIYPKSDKPEEAVKALNFCRTPVPVIIEETFPLSCTVAELEQFLLDSRSVASGWIWHYDGFTPTEYDVLEKQGKLTIAMSVYRVALRSFEKTRNEMRPLPGAK